MDNFFFISIIFVLIIISFFISAAESAFSSLKNWQIKKLSKAEKNRDFKRLDDSFALLSSLSFGSILINSLVISICISTSIELKLLNFIVLFGIMITVIALLCEIIPKTLALNAPEKMAIRLARPVFTLNLLSKPFRILAENIVNYTLKLLIPKELESNPLTTEEEFAELINWAYQQGVIEKSEREILEEIIKLDQRTAEEVMKPRSEMICIEDDINIEEMVSAAKKHKYTRLPIFHEKTDNIVGILNTRKLLLYPEEDFSWSIEFPSFVPATINLMDLLIRLRKQRRGLAIVLDEFGGTAGLITIEDVLEELIGEIREEGETAEFTIEKLNRNRWRVNGNVPVEDFQKIAPDLKSFKEVDTMAGLIIALNEVVPENGISTMYSGFELTIVASDERRIKELIVKKLR